MDPQAEFEALRDQARAACAELEAAGGRAQALLGQIPNARARGRLHKQLWDLGRLKGENVGFFSQAGQDAWLERHVFRGRRDGRFLEIGGYDGLTGSNCLFFELQRGWEGILVEPSPRLYAQANAFRRCRCLQLAIAAREGEAEFLDVRQGYLQMGGLVDTYDPEIRRTVESNPQHQGEVIRVPTRTLASILDEAGWQELDYISLDVEGGELAILEGFDFERYRVRVWTVENNRSDGRIPQLMQARGYRRAEALGVDDVYIRD